jgi:phosphohistidine phosphatase
MKLYVARHGIALDVGEQGIQRDQDRTLSPEGRRKTQEVAEGLAAIGVRPRMVATSPLPRAQETASILAGALCPDVSVEACDFMCPGAAARDVVDWLGRSGAGSAMIVGHMPDCAEIVSELVCQTGSAEVVFKKAGVCCVSFEGSPAKGAGEIEWLMQPKQMRALAPGGGRKGKRA